MAKVNVSIGDDLLGEVDSLARELDLSRSGFVQEATARYVATVREEQAEKSRRESILEALAEARRLSVKVGSFDSTAVIRADRDSDYGNGLTDG